MSNINQREKGRTTGGGKGKKYILVKHIGHQRATPRGYVYEHILVAEKILGKSLPPKSVVHHINGDGHDNRPENLIVCQDDAYHHYLHQRERAFKEIEVAVAISQGDMLPPEEPHWLVSALQGVSKGERDSTATRLAGYFLGAKLPESHVRAILEAWNTRNSPPLKPTALTKVIKSIAGREAVKPTLPVPDPADPPKQQRATMIDGVNSVLELHGGNAISKIQLYQGEEPDYVLTLQSRQEVMLTPKEALNQGGFRAAIYGATGHVIPRIGSKKNPNAWDDISRAIGQCAEVVMVGREATGKGALSSALERYLAANPPERLPEGQTPDEEPFWHKGVLHIFSHHFAKYLYLQAFQRQTVQQLARRLKSLGWNTVQLRFGELRTRAWAAPPAFETPPKSSEPSALPPEPLPASEAKVIPLRGAE